MKKCYLCDAKPPAVTLHLFPKDTNTSSLWRKICNLETFDNHSSLHICSQHFIPSDYIDLNAKKFGGTLRLLQGRYPTVNVPNKTVVSMDASDKIDLADPGRSKFSASDTVCLNRTSPHTSKRRKYVDSRNLTQITTPNIPTPQKASHFKPAKEFVIREQRKSESLRQKRRRLLKRILTLGEILEHLRKKHCISEDTADDTSS